MASGPSVASVNSNEEEFWDLHSSSLAFIFPLFLFPAFFILHAHLSYNFPQQSSTV